MATFPSDPDDAAAMKARLKALSGELDGRRAADSAPKRAAGAPSPNGMGEAMSLGFRVLSEFVASVVVGGFIGWAIDRGLGISPLGLIVFGALGTVAGFWSVYRIAARPTGPGRGAGK